MTVVSMADPPSPALAGKVPTPKMGATVTVDEAIRMIGVGPFHWLLVVATGMCSACVICEVASTSYLLSPAAWASCDLQMTSADKNLLSSIVFIGMLGGTHLWGVLADSRGRVPLLRISLLGEAVLGMTSALLPDKRLFIAARLINGFLVAGPSSMGMALLGEFHTESSRAKAILLLGLFPGGASLLLASLAYLVLPTGVAWSLPWLDTPFRSWRLFVLISSTPALLTGLAFLLWVPESPRFLMAAGRPDLALRSLRKAFAMNQGRGKEFPIGALVSPQDAPVGAGEDGPRAGKRQCCGDVLAVWTQTVPLFGRRHLRNTLLMCIIMFALVASANGVLVWMPEIFNRVAAYTSQMRPGEEAAVSACHAVRGLGELAAANASSASSSLGGVEAAVTAIEDTLQLAVPDLDLGQQVEACGGVLQDAMFINTGIIGVANVAVGLLGAVAVNSMGKRNMLVGSLLLAGMFGGLMAVLPVPSASALLGLACGLISLTNNCIGVMVSLAVDNYPTSLRATAVSLGMLAGRSGSMTGSLAFGVLLETQCAAAFWGLAALLAACGVLGLLLPRRGRYAA